MTWGGSWVLNLVNVRNSGNFETNTEQLPLPPNSFESIKMPIGTHSLSHFGLWLASRHKKAKMDERVHNRAVDMFDIYFFNNHSGSKRFLCSVCRVQCEAWQRSRWQTCPTGRKTRSIQSRFRLFSKFSITWDWASMSNLGRGVVTMVTMVTMLMRVRR